MSAIVGALARLGGGEGKTLLLRCDNCGPPVFARCANIFITRLSGLIHLAVDPADVRNAAFTQRWGGDALFNVLVVSMGRACVSVSLMDSYSYLILKVS